MELTPKAKRYLDNVLPDWFGRVGELMNRLSEKERAVMLKSLEKVHSRTEVFSNGTQKAAA